MRRASAHLATHPSLRAAGSRPLTAHLWATAILWLVATKPFADALSERTLRDQFDPGTLWAATSVALLAGWLLSRRRLPWDATLLALGWTSLAGLAAFATMQIAGLPAAVEAGKVLAGLAPIIVWVGLRGHAHPRSWRSALVVFGVGIAIHVVVAWLQAFGLFDTTYSQSSMGRTIGRPSGLFFHPVTLAYHLVFLIVAAGLLERRGYLRPATAVAIIVTAAMTVLVSTHRMGTVAMALSVLAVILARMWPRRRHVRRIVVAAVLTAIVVTAVGGTLTRDLWARPANVIVDGVIGVLRQDDLDPTSDRFLRGRGQIWADALQQIAAADVLRRWAGYGTQIVDPHTDYLRLPLVHGIAGSAILVATLALIIVALGRRADPLGAWYLAVTVALLLLYAFTTKPTAYPSFMWLWSLVAWLAAATSRPRHQREPT